jgi:murein DD-endopeptidase MepM/ murein hydrolase activator NlpD
MEPGAYIYFGFLADELRDGVHLCHPGVDMTTRLNQGHAPVFAAADGVVIYSYLARKYWYGLVVIRHAPTLFTRYIHLRELKTRGRTRYYPGQTVRAGTLLGYTREDLRHCHFEISPTTILNYNAEYFAGNNRPLVKAYFADPEKYLSYF